MCVWVWWGAEKGGGAGRQGAGAWRQAESRVTTHLWRSHALGQHVCGRHAGLGSTLRCPNACACPAPASTHEPCLHHTTPLHAPPRGADALACPPSPPDRLPACLPACPTSPQVSVVERPLGQQQMEEHLRASSSSSSSGTDAAAAAPALAAV